MTQGKVHDGVLRRAGYKPILIPKLEDQRGRQLLRWSFLIFPQGQRLAQGEAENHKKSAHFEHGCVL